MAIMIFIIADKDINFKSLKMKKLKIVKLAILFKRLDIILESVAIEILKTPTGIKRDSWCNANIYLMKVKEELQNVLKIENENKRL